MSLLIGPEATFIRKGSVLAIRAGHFIYYEGYCQFSNNLPLGPGATLVLTDPPLLCRQVYPIPLVPAEVIQVTGVNEVKVILFA